ncbi:YceD family protein [Roseateles violae]|uniref:Large ribosomal RNA subunit accumulation protein YceD n=1 Tax=Roseateles violae TaxID=3058042 RepID=A0ABT8DRH3_9BURK|nr:DUF177 domain-containing protein [Pelomonas sp. PFR6]MDN3920937.1 DUF177 domain-containing protein [Pelomonas sp. PFR6]
MKARVFTPHKLDVEAFARDGASLQGEWPAQALSRLADSAAPEAPASAWPAVRWSLEGEARAEPRSSDKQIWLHLEASARVSLTCQRCLQPVSEDLNLSRWFRFVRGEEEAASLDADSEDDVLALTRSLDAQELVEDELLLALPLVPRHETCPEPLPHSNAEPDEEAGEAQEDERPNPFAALAALKGRGPAQ